MMHPHSARTSAEFAAAWWANYFFAPDIAADDLDEVDPTTAVLKTTPVALPGSVVDDGAIAQEQVSRLFTGISERVAAELSQGRPARLYVSDHAVDPMLDDALAEAGIDLADGRLAFRSDPGMAPI
jgi:hypothetical protein